MNETDVRENVVVPLLRELGYRHSSVNDVITEQTLRYPKSYIGRKKKGKDQDIRGKADYILEVEQRLRWVIEVKAPEIEISIDDIEQAYSYAYHPEVRAIYFVVTNGRIIKVFQTVSGPNADEVFSVNYEDLEGKFQSLSNILSPESLKRDNPEFVLDAGKPLAPGFRSFAKLMNGKITYTENSLNHPSLKGLNIFISDGAVQRLEDGGIVAYLKTESPFQQMQELNKLLGLEVFDVFTKSEEISSDLDEPTEFVGVQEFAIPQGTPLYDFTKGTQNISPIEIPVKTVTKAIGVLTGETFHGCFEVYFSMNVLPAPISMKGEFEVKIG